MPKFSIPSKDYVQRVVDNAPPLTPQQSAQLSRLLSGGGIHDTGAATA